MTGMTCRNMAATSRFVPPNEPGTETYSPIIHPLRFKKPECLPAWTAL